MEIRKTKIEAILDDGTMISIVGSDIDRIIKYLELIKSIKYFDNDFKYSDESKFVTSTSSADQSIFDRLYTLIRDEFGSSIFTLNDVYRLYQMKYEDSIKKSTLATYLARLVSMNKLRRFGSRGRYYYQLNIEARAFRM